MSTIKVNNIQSRTGNAISFTSGDTITIPSGATLTNNGTANFGKIGQVVQTTKTNSFTTTSTSMVDITGFSASITPTSTSSKILVKVTIGILTNSGAYGTFVNLLRDSTNLISNSDGGAADTKDAWITSGGQTYTDNNRYKQSPSINYLDSPSTSSSVIYKCQMCVDGGSTTAYFNRWGVNTDHAAVSTLTLMEVLA